MFGQKGIMGDYRYLAVGALVVFIALFPFWFFGEYSALGWYDEVDAQIPWNYNYLSNQHNAGFVHNFAGGAGFEFAMGTPEVSLYRFFLENFPLWIANLLTRFLSLFSFFAGLFLLLRNLFGTSALLAFTASVFALFASYLPYGWTLNGHGWDLSAVIWITLALLGRFPSIRINYMIGLATVVISPLLSGPIFLLPLGSFMLLFTMVTFLDYRNYGREYYRLWLIIGLLGIILLFINWNTFFDIILGAKEFSGRLVGAVSAEGSQKTFVELFTASFIKEVHIFERFSGIFSSPTLNTAYGIIVILVLLRRHSMRPAVILFVLGIFFPAFLDALAKATEIDILKSYRWNAFWYLLPISVALTMAYLLRQPKRWDFLPAKYETAVIVFILALTALSGINRLAGFTIESMEKKGGSAIVTYYHDLQELPHKDERMISDHQTVQWGVPIYYDLRTFDGISAVFSQRRNYFIAYGVHSPLKETIHPNKHFFKFVKKQLRFERSLLEMANVRYLLSRHRKLHPYVEGVKYIQGLRYSQLESNNPLKPLFIKEYGDITLVNDLYVFKLPNTWPMAFVAGKVAKSPYSFKDKAFYEGLKKLQKPDILLADEDAAGVKILAKSDLVVEKYSLDSKGMTVQLKSGERGYLVFNQDYTPFWRAVCDQKKTLPLIPVNGIMMAAEVSEPCREVAFIYRGGE